MRRLRLVPILVTCTVLLVLGQGVCDACPTCKEGLAGDPAHAALVRGYFWSIVFMMSMPFLILGGVSSYFYYQIRRARQARLLVEQAAISTSI